MALVMNPQTGQLEDDGQMQDATMPVAQPTLNPQVVDMLSKKFNLGPYSTENRQQLVDSSKVGTQDKIGAALASLGAGFLGRDPFAAGQAKLNAAKQANADKISAFDKNRINTIQDISLSQEQTKFGQEQDKYAKSQDLAKRESDPMSEESQIAQKAAAKMGYQGDVSKITATQFKAFSPAMEKIYQIEQQRLGRQDAQADREKARLDAKEERALSRESMANERVLNREILTNERQDRYNVANQDKITAALLKAEDKKTQEAKPSDKQIEAFTDLDKASSDLNNILGELGDKSGWTGPVDGRIPDMLVGSDQVAWRSAVGKYKDAYRKAITGAGAGPTEIAKLESRLPSETDTLGNFKAKANEALQELVRHRETMSTNLEKGGKNIDKFKPEVKPVDIGGFPKTVRKNGQSTTVNDANEEKEAKSEGWQ